ncbi:MAG: hypothetical protein COA79_17475 [Planctomycetota bacterium]|nr:MAG: hypothetical protein COA79_17475 [Planctomycetota bacterium]
MQKDANGFFDGDCSYLSYFTDWYRTVKLLIHEGRHQYDSLILKKLHMMPKWYFEGIAEYYSQHKWVNKKLTMGELHHEVNFSLYYIKSLVRKGKMKNIEDFLSNHLQDIQFNYYHNTWAFIYFLKKSEYANGFKKWEVEMINRNISKPFSIKSTFMKFVTKDFNSFNNKYKAKLKEWSSLSPRNIRKKKIRY